MAISPVTVSTDYQGMQTDTHGTEEFPVACFDENMDRDVCVWHWHDSFEIILVTGGIVCVRIGRETLFLREGQGIFINARQLHICQRGEAPVSTFHSIVFSPSAAGDVGTVFWQKYMRPVMSGDAAYVIFGHGTLPDSDTPDVAAAAPGAGQTSGGGSLSPSDISDLAAVAPAAKQTSGGAPLTPDARLCFHAASAWQAEADEPSLYEITVRYHLTCFLALVAEKMRSQNIPNATKPSSEREKRDVRRMRNMLRYIEDHYRDQITLPEIAKSASLSEGECIRCFQRSIHTSPVQYVKHYRILRAREFLLEPDVSITEVAERCGYQDPGYFIRCFTRLTGSTPGQYRRKAHAAGA